MSITGQQFLNEAETFKSDPYVYGAAGPSSFDCSGLIQYSLQQLGLTNVPRTSEEQYAWVNQISKAQLQPGDLVFAQFPGDDASPGHVGIYAGKGQVYSAESPQSGIGLSSLASWGNNVVGYGQVPGVAGSGTATTSSGGTGFSWTNPTSWLPSIVQPIETPINDILERGALIVFGAILVLVGMYRMTGAKPPEIPKGGSDGIGSKPVRSSDTAGGGEDGAAV